MRLHLSSAERRTLMEVALGEASADLVVRNARLLNVYTGEWLAAHDVAVRGADLLLVPDVRDLHPSVVYSHGRLIARNGSLVVPPRAVSFPTRMLTSVRRPRLIEPRDFDVSNTDGPATRTRHRAG